MFADKPGFIAGQMLLALIPDPLRWPIGGADADSGKAGFELALRPASILEPSATGLCEPDLHVFAKLFEDRLERGLEAQALSGREIGGDYGPSLSTAAGYCHRDRQASCRRVLLCASASYNCP